MKKFNIITLNLFSLIILSACQTTPKTTVELSDPDIVFMSGFGGTGISNGLLGVKPMTFEELKSCGTKVNQLNKESNRLKVEFNKNQQIKKELDLETKAIDNDRLKINVTSFIEVAEFNKRLERTRELISQLDVKIEKYNLDIEANNLLSNQFNLGCASRSYRQSDMKRLPSELLEPILTVSKVSNVPISEDVVESPNVSSDGSIHIPASHSGR